MKMCFLCQIVNKDNNTPQAKKIFRKEIRRNGSIIFKRSHFNDPKNDFLCSSEHDYEAV